MLVLPLSLGHILSSEPRLLQLKSPAYVFGDFHGNMPDLLAFAHTMWPLGIHLTPGSFLFLGDYVDRGKYGIEILAYIFAQKIMLRDKVFLLRGNHEIRAVNVLPSSLSDVGMRSFLWKPLFPGPTERALLRRSGYFCTSKNRRQF